MEQLVLDANAAKSARDVAIRIVDRNADVEWKRTAEMIISLVATQREYFTTDDVWVDLVRYHPSIKTHEPRALGAMMKSAARQGVVEVTNEYVPSSRRECHARPVRVWRSCVFQR